MSIYTLKDTYFERKITQKLRRIKALRKWHLFDKVFIFKNYVLQGTYAQEVVMFTNENLAKAQSLLEVIQFFNQKGWTPATSSNFSLRSTDTNQFIISRSGVDKSNFKIEDLILINPSGEILSPFNTPKTKSSAETQIHTALYQKYPWINCVLHTHSPLGTALSQVMAQSGEMIFEGLEILKAFEGNSTHELSETLPIVPNSQNIADIIRDMDPHLTSELKIHGFLIAGHGLYAWGKDVATAKRHIEAFEFLFECFNIMRRY
jgi:methylthioribulose-1-phosphate dehydratase